jgi:hypothetical protein
MAVTINRVEAVRAHLDATQPGWQHRLRADLDALTPGWESFPLLVWDEGAGEWVEVVLLANPESRATRVPNLWARLRRWLGRG